MYNNCTIHISISYRAVFTEVLPHNVESTEVAIENGIHQLLIELFGEDVLVENVVVQHTQPAGNVSDESIFRPL